MIKYLFVLLEKVTQLDTLNTRNQAKKIVNTTIILV